MADLERLAVRASDGITRTLSRLGKLAAAVILVTAAVGAATFVTGWWVFEGSPTWLLIGGIICLIPVAAAGIAWFLVVRTVSIAPRLLGEIRTYLGSSGATSGVLIDHDSGVPLGMQAKSLSTLRADLLARRHELPALFAGVRTITTVPGLAAVAVVALVGVGSLGTLLLVAGLLD